MIKIYCEKLRDTAETAGGVKKLRLVANRQCLYNIKTGVTGNTILDKNQASTSLVPVSTISLHDLFQNINPQDANFLKYVPDGFLNEEQKQAKNKALEEERVKYGRDESPDGEDFTGFNEPDVSEDGVTYESRLLHTMRGEKITTEGQAYIKKICKNLGIEIVFENVYTPKGKHADGYIDSNGVIHLDYHCSNPVEFVLKHELTHYGESSALYSNFCKAVISSEAFAQWIDSKGGNRHGTSAEQRVTLDLADDYYQILEDSKYNYSKDETGKDNSTHKDVKQWHYFINDIYFAEYGEDEYIPYRDSINVKEKSDGEYVYSFSAEKQEKLDTQQTLHAVVNSAESTANVQLTNNRVPQNDTTVNSNSMQEAENHSFELEENTSENEEKTTTESFSIPTDAETSEEADITEIPDLMAVITDRYKRGKLTDEEYRIALKKQANEQLARIGIQPSEHD